MRAGAVLPLLLFAALSAVCLPSRAVHASQVEVEISAPKEGQVGHEVQIRVTIRSSGDGVPIADAEVTLLREASFARVVGDVELARAVTDQNGVGILPYEPTVAGEQNLVLEYTSPDGTERQTAALTISVAEGPQIQRSTAGIRVPGLNVWALIAVLSAVWAILFSTALLMVRIGRIGREEATASPRHADQTPGREEPLA
jgi:hypothetical protein